MYLYAGSEIWCNVRGLQMNPEVFPEPNEFRPERWLGHEDTDEPENQPQRPKYGSSDAGAHNFPDLSFTLGPHSCLGRNLAVLELRMAIACILNQFTCTLKPGHVIDTKVVLTTKPRNGVLVNFQSRVWDTASGAIYMTLLRGDRESLCVRRIFFYCIITLTCWSHNNKISMLSNI